MNTIINSTTCNTIPSYINNTNTSTNTNKDNNIEITTSKNSVVLRPASSTELSKNADQIKSDDFEEAMYQNLTDFSMSYNKGCYEDNTKALDSIISTAQRYKDYINSNFSGDDKKKYLNCLNEFTNDAAQIAASFIAGGIQNFFGLDQAKTQDISDNIVSIVNDKINGKVRTKKPTSLEDMDYDTLKTLSAGLAGIDKAFTYNMFCGFDDVNSHAACLGLANMETNFLVQKTDLPDKIKEQLTKRVDKKVEDGINEAINLAAIVAKVRAALAKEKGVSLDDIADYEKETNLKRLRERVNKITKQFSGVKFDKSFLAGFFAMIDNINKQCQKDMDFYKKVDAKLGTKISAGLEEAQSHLTDTLTSSWNDFINNLYNKDDKTQYLLPSSTHHVVSVLA